MRTLIGLAAVAAIMLMAGVSGCRDKKPQAAVDSYDLPHVSEFTPAKARGKSYASLLPYKLEKTERMGDVVCDSNPLPRCLLIGGGLAEALPARDSGVRPAEVMMGEDTFDFSSGAVVAQAEWSGRKAAEILCRQEEAKPAWSEARVIRASSLGEIEPELEIDHEVRLPGELTNRPCADVIISAGSEQVQQHQRITKTIVPRADSEEWWTEIEWVESIFADSRTTGRRHD
jgi:hypothetical protein